MPRKKRTRLKFDEDSVNRLFQEIYDESHNTKAKITALVCKGLNLPKLNHEIPSVILGKRNIKARISPTNIPTTPNTIVA
jgi:hypothetical protein